MKVKQICKEESQTTAQKFGISMFFLLLFYLARIHLSNKCGAFKRILKNKYYNLLFNIYQCLIKISTK